MQQFIMIQSILHSAISLKISAKGFFSHFLHNLLRLISKFVTCFVFKLCSFMNGKITEFAMEKLLNLPYIYKQRHLCPMDYLQHDFVNLIVQRKSFLGSYLSE